MGDETKNVSEKEKALERLKLKIKQYSPEQMLSPENKARIRKNYLDGVIVVANFVELDIEMGTGPDEAWKNNPWSLKEMIRTILTNPLPEKTIRHDYDGNENKAPPDVYAAENYNWFEQLSEDQLEALSKITGVNLIIAKQHKPSEKASDDDVIILDTTEQLVTAGGQLSFREKGFNNLEERRFCPAVIWRGGPAITTIPEEVIEKLT
jgi:hypothetical protein